MAFKLDYSLRCLNTDTIAGVFYNDKNGSSFITSKSSSKNLSNENKHTLLFPKNWHFNSRFVLKTTKTPVFVFITEIRWQTFWRDKWRSVFDVVKRLLYKQNEFSPFRFWWLPEETNTGAKRKEFLVQRLLGGFIWLRRGSKILWNQVRQSWNSLPTATAKALQP